MLNHKLLFFNFCLVLGKSISCLLLEKTRFFGPCIIPGLRFKVAYIKCSYLSLQPRDIDKAAMLGVNTIKFFLKNLH